MIARRVFDESTFTDPAVVAVIDDLPLWSAPFGLRLLDAVRLRRGITAVDIGSGMGFPIVELAERLGRESRVHAVDPWQPGLERIRAKLAGRAVTNVTLHHASAEQLPFADGAVDLITSNNGLNNVADLDRSLRECARVARRGAQLVVTWNLPGTMHEFYDVFREVLAEAVGNASEAAQRIDEHILAKRKPVDYLREHLESVGFSVARVAQEQFDLRFIDGTAMFDHFLMRTGFAPAWLELVEPALRDRVFDEVEARLNAVATRRGELSLTIPWACLDGTRS